MIKANYKNKSLIRLQQLEKSINEGRLSLDNGLEAKSAAAPKPEAKKPVVASQAVASPTAASAPPSASSFQQFSPPLSRPAFGPHVSRSSVAAAPPTSSSQSQNSGHPQVEEKKRGLLASSAEPAPPRSQQPQQRSHAVSVSKSLPQAFQSVSPAPKPDVKAKVEPSLAERLAAAFHKAVEGNELLKTVVENSEDENTQKLRDVYHEFLAANPALKIQAPENNSMH